MADDLLFMEHSHLIEKGVSAFFFLYVIEQLVRFYKSFPSFFSQKIINIAEFHSVLAIVCNYFYIFVVKI